MNVRLSLLALIAAPLASIALAQMYPTPQPARPTVPAQPGAAAPAAAPAQPSAPTAQAAATAPDTSSIPAHNCVQPQYPGKSAGNERIKKFNEGYKDYRECINKYVATVRGIRDAAMAKGNEAVEQYNKYTEEVQKQLDADK
jgi:hypothetical protein